MKRFDRSERIAWRLPLYVRLILFVVVGITSLTSVVVLLARQNQPPSDFWTAYVSLFSGKSSIERCPQNLLSPGVERLCHYQNQSEVRPMIEVFLCERDTCSRVDLFESVSIGRLALYWGKPEVHSRSQTVYLTWPRLGVWAVAQTASGKFSYFLPVSVIYGYAS
jgi:hypothetical protein